MIRSFLLATLVVALLTRSGAAVPWNFQINMDVPAGSSLAALRGASLQINGSWDPAGLTPLLSNQYGTTWPATNTTVSLAVAGSQGHDGIYFGEVISTPTDGWALEDYEKATKDSMTFPRMIFTVGNTVFRTSPRAIFPKDFFNIPGVVHPRSFTSDQAIWASTTDVVNLSGFASFVPEPSSLTVAAVALASLAVLRRRR